MEKQMMDLQEYIQGADVMPEEPPHCSSQDVLRKYFFVLRRLGVWPTVSSFEEKAPSDILTKLCDLVVPESHLHVCGLRRRLESLSRRANEILSPVREKAYRTSELAGFSSREQLPSTGDM